METQEGKMGEGGRFALGILVMFIAMIFFFFAFHPGGVVGVSNPAQMLRWLLDEFNNLAGGTQAASTTAATSADNALNYPGYTSTSDVGSAQPQIQLA
jgi:hypothetical protein